MSILITYIIPPEQEFDYVPSIKAFLESYKKYTPTIEHKLVLVFKDWPFQKATYGSGYDVGNAQIEQDTNRGYDIGTFIRKAKINKDYEYFVGLSTHARLLCPNWLELMYIALQCHDTGLVGATGSYEKGAKGTNFPNYHIRTSCFMIRTKLFNSLKFPEIEGKDECYEVEHGDKSLTWQVLNKGHRCLVAGKDGGVFDKEWWPHSYTFRHGDQENLIASDNHTRNFDNLPKDRQIQMYKEAYFTGDR